MLASIIIPYTERKVNLDLCLDALAKQTYRPLEILLVSSRTVGESYELCKNFAQRYEENDFSIRLIYTANGTACAARNEGFRQSKGKYICFFDSDDEMSPRFVDHMVKCLVSPSCYPKKKQNSTLAWSNQEEGNWVLARTVMCFPNGKSKIRIAWSAPSIEAQILGSFVSTQSWLAHRSFLQKVAQKSFPNTMKLSLWNEELPIWNDYELGVRLLQYSEQAPRWSNRVFHRIYQHSDSITATHKLIDKWKTLLVITQRVAEHAFSFSPAIFAALYWRAAILDGHYKSNYRHELYNFFPTAIFTSRRKKSLLICVGTFLSYYVRYRGIAAWRIAYYFLRFI